MRLAQAIERLLPLLLFFTTMATSYFWWRSEHRYEAALQRIDSLQKASRSVRDLPPPSVAAPAKPEIQTRIVKVPSPAASPELARTIEQLQERVQALAGEVQTARQSVSDAERNAAETERRRAAEADRSKEQVEALRRTVAAIEGELKFKNERLARMESVPAPKPTAVPPPKPSGPTPAELERNRRREALLASLLRRYREVTELYRSFTLRQPDMQAGDLSRIQSAIMMAEDEMRQLQALK